MRQSKATALPPGEDKSFYEAIAASEARHWQLFVELAEDHCDAAAVPGRLAEIVAVEAQVMARLPLRPALH